MGDLAPRRPGWPHGCLRGRLGCRQLGPGRSARRVSRVAASALGPRRGRRLYRGVRLGGGAPAESRPAAEVFLVDFLEPHALVGSAPLPCSTTARSSRRRWAPLRPGSARAERLVPPEVVRASCASEEAARVVRRRGPGAGAAGHAGPARRDDLPAAAFVDFCPLAGRPPPCRGHRGMRACRSPGAAAGPARCRSKCGSRRAPAPRARPTSPAWLDGLSPRASGPSLGRRPGPGVAFGPRCLLYFPLPRLARRPGGGPPGRAGPAGPTTAPALVR